MTLTIRSVRPRRESRYSSARKFGFSGVVHPVLRRSRVEHSLALPPVVLHGRPSLVAVFLLELGRDVTTCDLGLKCRRSTGKKELHLKSN